MKSLNLVAPINTTSYGVVGTNILKELCRAGIPPKLIPIGPVQLQNPEDELFVKNSLDFANAKFSFNELSLRIFHQFDLSLHCGSPRVAFPIFELDRFNDVELHHMRQQDKLLVCSEWAKTIIQTHVETPVDVVPLGVDRNIFSHLNRYKGNKHRNVCVFLNIGKFEIRKGHDFLVDCFNKAFEKDDDVQLVMAIHNWMVPEQTKEFTEFALKTKMGHKITIVADRLKTQFDIANLMYQCDVGVFPSRAEGWGLELLECMAMGMPCIATNYSGHTEYANSDNCKMISVKDLELAIHKPWFYGQGNWAKLDIEQEEQMIEYMRYFNKQKQENGKVEENKGGIDAATKFSWGNSVTKLLKSLENL